MSSDVPDGWASGPVLDFFQLQRGHDLPVQERNTGPVPIIASNGVVGFHDQSSLAGPGVITGRSGSIGNVNFVEGAYWPLNTTLYVRDFKSSDPKFVYYFLQNFPLKDHSTGTGVPTLNRNNVHAVEVAFPPLDEQRRIAEVLRSMDEAIAAAETVADKARSLLVGLGREVMQSPDDEPLPGSSKLGLLDICRPKQHPTIGKAVLTAHGYPVYGANGQIGYFHSYTHAEPVIAVTCRGATCGTVNWVPSKSYVTGNAMALDELDRKRMHERFLYHYISAWGVVRSISGSAQPQITRQSLSCIDIVAPDLTTQQNIAAALDALEHQAGIADDVVDAAITVKADLMSDLLSGRVRVPA